MQISEAKSRTAGAYVDLVAAKLGQGRAVQSDTAIASTARLAGSLLLRSFNLDTRNASPGTVILSNEANENGPRLVNIMSIMLQQFGIALNDSNPDGAAPKLGTSTEMSTMESLALLQDDAIQIAASHQLNLKDAADAAAMATAFVVKECTPNLDASIGFGIAMLGIVEGCKTVPPPLRQQVPAPAPAKKPWYRLW